MKKTLLTLITATFLAGSSRAEQVALDTFGYLNNNDSSVIIGNNQAQDLLNVDVTDGGKSIKKREGYGVFKTLTSGQAIHGGHHFFNSGGSDIQVWGSSTSLWGIVSGGTATQLISSGTLNATWDCASSQGYAYCVSSGRDALIRTDGATSTWYTSPLGTMVSATPERLLVAGVSGATSSIYVSEANVFTNFTVGNSPSSPFIEVISAPGSRLTHLEYGCGRILWWKDQSFGYMLGTDQTDIEIVTVSGTIGTLDNSSAIDPGGAVYFRGQDGHIYRYNCSDIEKLTTDITPNVQLSGQRISNSWTQSSQSEFEAGSIVPTGHLSTTLSPGEVVPSSYSVTESTGSDWTLGSTSNTVVGTSSITLAVNNLGDITNNSFESALAGNWTETGTGVGGSWASVASTTQNCTINPQSGSAFALVNGSAFFSSAPKFEAIDLNGDIVGTVTTAPASCSWVQSTLTPSAQYVGTRVKFRIHLQSSPNEKYLTTDDSYIWGGPITLYASKTTSGSGSFYWAIDNIQAGSSTITSGSFTSQTFDTGFTSSTIQVQAAWTTNTSTPTVGILHSSFSTGGWASLTASTGTSAVGNRYIRYVSTITVSPDATPASITSATLIAKSSGTFYSAVKNASSLAEWDVFAANTQATGGTHTFYVRSSTDSFTVLSSTPSWVAQTAGGLVTASTGTYFQVRDDFSITVATATPTLSDFTVNWFEGTASDKAYAIFFDDAVWWSVAYGAGQSTNNYIFKYDLVNPGWTLYNFGAGGFAIRDNSLHFGSTSTGNVYKFGDSKSDNGSSISAYWKSKDFAGQDPWLDNEYTQLDVIALRDANQTLTVGYTLSGSTTTASYSVSLSNSLLPIIRHKKLLPAGTNGSLFNVKFSDDSATSSWELLGFRFVYRLFPYKPTQ